MPRYYCDYCDAFLTHDSASVRKTHNQGRKHRDNVRAFYQKWYEENQESLMAQGFFIPPALSQLTPITVAVGGSMNPFPQSVGGAGLLGMAPPGGMPQFPGMGMPGMGMPGMGMPGNPMGAMMGMPAGTGMMRPAGPGGATQPPVSFPQPGQSTAGPQ